MKFAIHLRMAALAILLSACGGSSPSNRLTQSMADGGDAGSGTLDAGGPPDSWFPGRDASVAQSAVCARYVSCSTLTSPASAAAVLAAYGPDGSCWKSTPQVAADCTTACERGLAQLHPSYPNEPGCAQCASDGECGGVTPACDATGTCVACTADRHCGGSTPACNVGTSMCVECTSDANCADPGRPHCNTATNACVACTTGSQCPSGVCMDSTSTCCVRKTTCYSGFNCGFDDDGCGGQVPCGTCSVGTCKNNVCSTVGQSCIPRVTACAPGEQCMFDAWHEAYKCAPPTPDFTCAASQDCETVYDSNNEPVEPYSCIGSTCYQNCLTTADCPSGTCQPAIGGAISPMIPGSCM
jgi:hypothetical protein